MSIVRFRRGCMALTAGTVLLVGMAALAAADPIVVPNLATTTEGTSNNSSPFDIDGPFPMQYQQIYAASEFRELGTLPLRITGIAFRPDAETGGAFAVTLPSVSISLSTTDVPVDGLSAVFGQFGSRLSSNVGSDNTLVRSGALSLASNFTGPPQGPKDFDIVIPFSTPFFYDPSRGNLLMDLFTAGGSRTVPFDAVVDVDGVSRAFDIPGAQVPAIDTLGLVTQFEATPVPEPATLTLLAVGLAGIGARRWRKAETSRRLQILLPRRTARFD